MHILHLLRSCRRQNAHIVCETDEGRLVDRASWVNPSQDLTGHAGLVLEGSRNRFGIVACISLLVDWGIVVDLTGRVHRHWVELWLLYSRVGLEP